MTKVSTKLDDVLDNEYAITYHEFKDGDTAKQFIKFKKEAKAQLLQLLSDSMDSLIGSDEPVKSIEGKSMMHNELAHINEVQNKLRAEQRQRKAKIIKELE